MSTNTNILNVMENHNNYFVRLRKSYGDDFVDQTGVLQLIEVKKNSKFIIRDIIKEKIDIKLYRSAFTNRNIMNALRAPLVEAHDKAVLDYKIFNEARMSGASETISCGKYAATINLLGIQKDNRCLLFKLIIDAIDEVMNTENIGVFDLLVSNITQHGLGATANKELQPD